MSSLYRTESGELRPYSFVYNPRTGVCYRWLTFLRFPDYLVGDDGNLWRFWKPSPIVALADKDKLDPEFDK